MAAGAFAREHSRYLINGAHTFADCSLLSILVFVVIVVSSVEVVLDWPQDARERQIMLAAKRWSYFIKGNSKTGKCYGREVTCQFMMLDSR